MDKAKIYTKAGDEGFSQSPDGTKLKSDPIFDLFGTIDEAQAIIGTVYEMISPEAIFFKKQLEEIMRQFYKISGSLYKKEDLTDNILVQKMEKWIDELDAFLEPLDHFILPIGSPIASQLHLSRTIVRRLEREFILFREIYSITENGTVLNQPNILEFLNRLSDYLFTLARFYGEYNN
jgi:cob(I)alamin adenosyltransferase